MARDRQTNCTWKPNLFVVGAPKCGTTSLCDYLGQHPEIFISPEKEPLFFCTDQEHHESWRVPQPERYLALFESGAGCRWRGEGSVWYLSSSVAAEHIRAFSPAARILIMLRNPVDMAVSLHAQFIFSGNENITDFEKAYATQAKRALGRRLPWRAHMPGGLQYTTVGRYAKQVERYLDMFPPEQIKVLIYEEFFADLDGSYRHLLDWLGVEQNFRTNFAAANRRHQIRSAALQRLLTKVPELWELPTRLPQGRMQAALQRRFEWAKRRLQAFNSAGADPGGRPRRELRRRLHGDFADDIDRLEVLLGRDLSLWRRQNLGEQAANGTAAGCQATPTADIGRGIAREGTLG